ncbi:hypothetical protein V1525DRAFT_398948 [Lipomyces kononenkoae]|uniref:Uncharacterized protein n=1 Tax=Lipomyces kononenkoae TaxID=34357 RepID=A0ACC3T6I0_LIPKO
MPPRHFAPRKGPPQLPGGAYTVTSQNKSSAPYSHGSGATKTSFERAKEAEEAKRLREEEETRAAYEDFVKSFQADDGNDISFVPGNTASGARGFTDSFSPPTGPKRRFQGPVTTSGDIDNRLQKRRHIEQLGELKRPDQARLDKLAVQESEAFSDSPDNPATTARTLYLCGLPSASTTISIKNLVAEFGVVRNATINPPDRKRRGLSAYVVFESSDEVEKARASLDRKYLGEGYWLSASFGKDEGPTARLDSRSGLPFNAQLPSDRDSSAPGQAFGNVAPPASLGSSGIAPPLTRPQIKVQYPDSLQSLRRIHAMVEHVIKFGAEFEAVIMQREKTNPDFAFLYDSDLAEHIYYRWKLWSLASGEGMEKWSTQPAEIFDDRISWIPPRLSATIDDELERLDNQSLDDEEEDKKSGGRDQMEPWLGPVLHLHLTLLLQHISMRRGSIARLMSFAIDNAYAADEIVDVTCQSITNKDVSTQVRVARLWAVGDILYNSGMGIGGVNKGVWKYRGLYQVKLIPVFASLYEVFKEFDGRIRADNFRRQIMSVLNVWEGWNVFTHDALTEMTNQFLGKTKEAEADQSDAASSNSVDMVSQVTTATAEVPIKKVAASKWKKVEKSTSSPQVGLSKSDSGQGGESTEKESKAKPFSIEDLIDPELDGEPLTDSDVDQDDTEATDKEAQGDSM